MINLNEAWKLAYEKYLEEDEKRISSDLDSVLEEMEVAQKEAKESFSLIEQFVILQGGIEEEVQALLEAPEPGTESPQPKPEEKLSNLVGYLKALADNESFKDGDYKPYMSVTVEKISDMKFPQNIVFFVKQLVLWIKNVVVYFVKKIINIFRRVLHMEELPLDKKDLKGQWDKAKTIEGTATTYEVGGRKKEGLNPIINVLRVPAGQSLTEDIITEDKEIVVIQIDISKDLQDLRLLLDHFYKLFDNCFGSNNEKLFGTEDLEMTLKILKKALEKLDKGDLPNVALYGKHAVEVDMVSADVVRNNLVMTDNNIRQLKVAYQNTASRIKRITNIIQSKELMMINQMGYDYKTLSASTYGTLDMLRGTIPARIKTAQKLEKDLNKMKSNYEQFLSKLSSLQSSFSGLGNISYSSIYTKKIQDLFQATKDMTDIVTLRLVALSLYIKELEDVKGCLNIVLNFNKYNDTFGQKVKDTLAY